MSKPLKMLIVWG